ncbi:hypothetical protein [Vibrio misgurnus]|uniref:hypothetical protein n=1 Tax=Vibrio misgurnus TaxID=2993714 RepID=UPI0023F852A1|nr:hypothetical protein [Vibrio sp. VCS]
MLKFNSKTDTVELCGQQFTLEYFQTVHAPLLVEALKWDALNIIAMFEREDIPLGRFGRNPKVANALYERAEEKRKAEAERKAEEERRRIMYPTKEELAERKRRIEANAAASRLYAATRLRSGSNSNSAENYTVSHQGDWS